MNTRFNEDYCRTTKNLQQATDPGRWVLNQPGWGNKPYYFSDPQIRQQTWGGNLRTNCLDIENEFRGMYQKPSTKNCQYSCSTPIQSEAISYPIKSDEFTAQPRATNPAWNLRDKTNYRWEFPLWDPQSNAALHFQNNASTRILEKDYFEQLRPCVKHVESAPVPSFSYNYPTPQK